MHIPDGYLGPVTSGGFFLLMLLVWGACARRLKKTLKAKQAPLLALGAAFSFVIMMFNLPVPGGSSGHATGGVLAAILLGPEASCIALTVVLVIQALLFGDGGLSTLGANCFNLAFVLPFSGYYVYKILSRGAPWSSKRKVFAASIAGYAGINAAALLAALELGLQPKPHYFPYGLKTTLAVMSGGHLLVFGWIEALVSGLVIKYLQKQAPELLPAGEKRAEK